MFVQPFHDYPDIQKELRQREGYNTVLLKPLICFLTIGNYKIISDCHRFDDDKKKRQIGIAPIRSVVGINNKRLKNAQPFII